MCVPKLHDTHTIVDAINRIPNIFRKKNIDLVGDKGYMLNPTRKKND